MELITLIGAITVFILAIFLGFELITKVPPTLHTPLMSGANAISGITIVGALIFSNTDYNNGDPGFAAWLAFFALILATINVVGGFAIHGCELRFVTFAELCVSSLLRNCSLITLELQESSESLMTNALL